MRAPSIVATATAATALLAAAFSAQAGPPRPIATKDFVAAAAQSDHFEIVEAQLAAVEGRDPRVHDFARQMIQAHTGTLEALRQATVAADLPPPSEGLSGDQAMSLSALQAQRGTDFDKTYIRQQMLGHSQALAVAKDYENTGGDPAIRQATSAAIPIIQQHLNEARQLCSSLHCDL